MIIKQGDDVQIIDGRDVGCYGKFVRTEYGKIQFDKAMYPKFLCLVECPGLGVKKVFAMHLEIIQHKPAPTIDYSYSSMFNKKVHTVQSYLASLEKKDGE
jgi:hypothetical protein